MEAHTADVFWFSSVALMEGMQAPPPSHGSSVPVVIKLRYSVLHFFGGGVTVQPPSTCRYFLFELSEFLHQESRRRAVSLLLSHINVHGGDFSVAQFLEENFNTLSDDLVELAMGSGRGIETEIDALFITIWGEEEDSFDYDLGRGGQFGGVPASSDSIAKLQAVRFEHGGGDFRESSCMICFEGFEVGMEVTRMPCMHVFHGDCLTRWLERSRLCPLCRHQLLPASADP